MSTIKKGGKKSFLVTTVLFSIAFVIYAFLFIRGYETDTTNQKLLRGILMLLFGILAVMNFFNYKRAKD
jgi:hypothetical protein